jgi:prephenate dehydrogenase
MTVQLTIIGLGQIGASVGLALAQHSDRVSRLGYDREPNIAKRAREMGAVDKVIFNLPAVVKNADIILLALPVNQIRETLQIIAPCLKENAVVMDTSPVKCAIAEWMKEMLPPTCYYVGLTPAINPLYLHEAERGINAAHPDLFTKGVIAIASPQGTVSEAVKLAADLSFLLGAAPFFVDLAEADSMMVAVHIMPQLSALVLVNMIMDRPGWKDARELTGRMYAEATSPVAYGDDDDALVEAVLQNRDKVIHLLNEMIINLEVLREEISVEERENLTKWSKHARQGHSKRCQERSFGDWQSTDFEKVEMPKSDLLKRMFGNPGKLLGLPKPNKREEKN